MRSKSAERFARKQEVLTTFAFSWWYAPWYCCCCCWWRRCWGWTPIRKCAFSKIIRCGPLGLMTVMVVVMRITENIYWAHQYHDHHIKPDKGDCGNRTPKDDISSSFNGGMGGERFGWQLEISHVSAVIPLILLMCDQPSIQLLQGPVLARAIATQDFTPNPYDRAALRWWWWFVWWC